MAAISLDYNGSAITENACGSTLSALGVALSHHSLCLERCFCWRDASLLGKHTSSISEPGHESCPCRALPGTEQLVPAATHVGHVTN